MKKFIKFLLFSTATLAVIGVFLTSSNYSQLAVASALYPALIVSGLAIFPRGNRQSLDSIPLATSAFTASSAKNSQTEEEPLVNVTDFDKRAFIKLIGATGISFFLFSLLGRRAENFFSKSEQPQIQPINIQTSGSPTDGYKITEIDDGLVSYFGFTNKDRGWLIMKEDADESTFRYAKGSLDFPGNWANRENLKYDYFYNLF